MSYEPVGYIVEYEVSALLFFVVIMLRYFNARRFPNQKNKLFALILWVVLIDIIMDIVSSFIIDNVFLVPVFVTYAVNALFYFLQIFLPILMTAYTLALVGQLTWSTARRSTLLLAPGAVMAVLLLSTPLTHLFFYVDPVLGYVRGPVFTFTYIACVFYMVVTLVVTLRNMSRLRRSEYITIYRFLSIVSVAMLVQYLVPALLLSGVAIALAVTLMYFTIQNPETMLDATTEAFTSEAMLAFLRDRTAEREMIQLTGVKVNNMSRINDLLGIENGSLLLRRLSAFLRESAPGSWVFRMRGGCFVAITRSPGDCAALRRLVDGRIGSPWVIGGAEVLLQATVCYVVTDGLFDAPITPEEAVNYLETAFAQGERSGSRISTVVADAEFLERIDRRRAVEAALREALESGEGLEPYFQPLWSVKRKSFTNAEVLLRFNHRALGFISPEEFVPIAESCGLVTAMDELVVRKTCAFIRGSDNCRGLGLDSLEVNLSALEFMHGRLPQLLRGIMSEYGVSPGFLCFEITETAATESFELLKDCMGQLTDLGCKFALDDFGTGYANISQVIQLPFSMVKLDRSLLYGPEVVLADMARMFARIDRLTVVEGVETARQAARISALGVDYIQGYHYARPMNARDFTAFLRENSQKV